MRRPIVAGNWKMNGSKESVRTLLKGISNGVKEKPGAVDIIVCPPSVFLSQVSEILAGTDIYLGAQNASHQSSGAYTGEISTSMLMEVGCKYLIVGHSERRALYAESDEIIAEKFLAAREAKIIPILCVGEKLEERETNNAEAVVARQIDAVLNRVSIAGFADAVIAYEPVWAIGTGKTATAEQAQEMHAFIRNKLTGLDQHIANKIAILYGGSVNAKNAKELFSMQDIDGGLIGGASLKVDDFLAVCAGAVA